MPNRLRAKVDQLEAECERHRRANLVRAVIQGHDDWVTDLINAKNFDAIPWKVAEGLARDVQALKAEVARLSALIDGSGSCIS